MRDVLILCLGSRFDFFVSVFRFVSFGLRCIFDVVVVCSFFGGL